MFTNLENNVHNTKMFANSKKVHEYQKYVHDFEKVVFNFKMFIISKKSNVAWFGDKETREL